jgi:hypothetical protein
MPCGTLTGIALDCAPEVGGISKLYIKELAGEAIEFTAADGAVALTGVSVGGAALVSLANDFEEFEMSKEVGGIVDTPTNTPAAGTTFFTCVVNGVFNGSTAENLQTLQALATSKRLMAIVLDNEGRYWMVGNEKGCILSAGSSQSGTAYGDLSGINVELTGISGTARVQVTV